MKKDGFTLVEAAIGIIIIGLVVAGFYTAKGIIYSSQINGVVKEFEQYQTVYRAFKLQYGKKPGDMTDAQDYFGTSVHNGNGNGILDNSEGRYAWQQLRAAELVNCVCEGSVSHAVPDRVLPISESLGNNYIYEFVYYSNPVGAFANKRSGLNLTLNKARWMGVNGTYPEGWYYYTTWFSMNGEDTHQIDLKIDDGKPFTGNLRSSNHYLCVNSTTKEYDLRESFQDREYCSPSLFFES